MANPRKFSEKIALHTQKQAEETAKFEQIMKEVSDVTAKVLPTTPDRGSSKHTLRINQTLGSFRGGSLPNVSAGGPKSTSINKESIKSEPQDTMQLMNLHQIQVEDITYREHQSRRVHRPSVGPMRSRVERRNDTSPYLSPPPDTSWRRTNSDSALHHSAMQGITGNDNSDSRWLMQNSNSQEQTDRPRSCDVSSRVPGINIYPTAQEPGTVQIPIGNNTGSLPDLTSVHFPPPLHTPLDQEADHSSSPYSSSPVSASPATLSPTIVHPTGIRTAQGQFQYTTRPVVSQHQNRLSVPVNTRYLHHNKGVTLENNVHGIVDGINYTAHSPLSMSELSTLYQQQCPTSNSIPTQQHQQQQQYSGPGYRSPQRPSPQSSPGLGGRHSAPSSPAAAPSPISDYFLGHSQAQTILHHFEQISMMDQPYNIDTPTTVQLTPNRQQNLTDVTSIVNSSDLGDTGYYTTSPSPHFPLAQTSQHTTPNTPTSIPDIILTDYTTSDLNHADFTNDLNRQEFSSKDISNVITGALDGDLFTTDESLRAGLGHLDFDGMQMLSDPEMSVISDNAEDVFRLDRL